MRATDIRAAVPWIFCERNGLLRLLNVVSDILWKVVLRRVSTPLVFVLELGYYLHLLY